MYPVLNKKLRLSKVDALESNPSGRRTIIRNDITTSSNTHTGSTIAAQQPTTIQSRRSKKSRIKSSTIAVYASVFVLLVVLIAIGYRAPQEVGGVANTATLPGVQNNEDDNATVNDVVATNIAANVASTTNLSVAPSVASLAISTQIESELPITDDSSISKPSIIQVSAASRNIAAYTVVAGDTVDTLAAKFKLSKDTIKWANNLVSDALPVGQVLQILPRDGIVYTVKSGDTIQGLADKYKANASTITTYNDLEISGIRDGLKIVIPGGILPTNERPGYSAPISSANSGVYSGFRVGSVGNKYGYGYCTWYVYERRAALGRPVGSYWGDAGSWKRSGELAGFVVNRTPAPGAVLVELGSPGHNAVVESVAENGDIIISEMNNRAYGGWNIINNRTLTAGQAANYWYVH
ncbi:MAG: LysM peptidoglycan-binding domain-containing protein [Candidatus Microsaccharimonas sp.]